MCSVKGCKSEPEIIIQRLEGQMCLCWKHYEMFLDEPQAVLSNLR